MKSNNNKTKQFEELIFDSFGQKSNYETIKFNLVSIRNSLLKLDKALCKILSGIDKNQYINIIHSPNNLILL